MFVGLIEAQNRLMITASILGLFLCGLCSWPETMMSVKQHVLFHQCRLDMFFNQLWWAHHSPSPHNSHQEGIGVWWWESFYSCQRKQIRLTLIPREVMWCEFIKHFWLIAYCIISTYFSSFIAICKGSVSPSSSTMTGAHILMEISQQTEAAQLQSICNSDK